MAPSVDEGDLETIRETLQDHPVRLGLLFGSAASGTMHGDSDLDIAVVLNGDPEDDEYVRRLSHLLTELHGSGSKEVDLVDLRTVDARFAGRITESSKVIYDPDGRAEGILDDIPTERPSKDELREETSELRDRLYANDG